ncbi:MAG TPA: cupin domain-containing protein [Chloroflexota bacterium]|nr:cupin domain-containing protein [Chloroflexota bacterium]
MAQTQTSPGERMRRITVDYERPYELWLETLPIPIHTGYYVEDVRTVEVAWWEERGCNAAILKLAGQEGITEARVTEIPPGKSLRPLKFALDEIVYVADGRGLTTVTPPDGGAPRTFEWQTHSLFMLPRNCTHQLSNAQGNRPARLLHYNHLPIAMTLAPDPEFFFDNPYGRSDSLAAAGADFYSEAKISMPVEGKNAPGLSQGMAYWLGNFFPDMQAWDSLVPFRGRGAGGHVVWIRYPGSTITNHMSVFPAQTYKKAHRHGPGVVIIIPGGEGYSVMWEEGKDKVFIPWHEGSVFVPPNRWFHQHFNVGGAAGRYLAFHAPRGVMQSERIEDRARDQIEYPDEDPWIRQTFESELRKRGLVSLMPEKAYQDRAYEWDYQS